ncbi:hypothetical protein BJY01DRAFT_245558 [Aspergillus pseudoustus]|uniref:Uncharacterized protein n=1 Tax=Aspergillus pseudoustus TaxID=1810923 RepID=A0ABR4KDZ2_9EURO
MSFTVQLVPEGDQNSEFRLRNEYEGQVERPEILDYGTNLNVQGSLVEVIHGTLTADGELATLIIMDFRFTTLSPPRRFRKATISVRFEDGESSDATPPEVLHISPDGAFAMNRSTTTAENEYGVHAVTGAGFSGLASLSLGVDWKLTESTTKTHQATLKGLRMVVGRGRPPKNAARWVLHENSEAEDGIPSYLRCAIIVRRKSTRPFLGFVQVHASADYKYLFEKRSGGIDPILFEPGPMPELGQDTPADGPPDISDLRVHAAQLSKVDLKVLAIVQSSPEVI